MIQQVYDDRTLHQLLGVEPRPAVTVVDARRKPESSQNGSSSKQPSARNIDEIEEVDMEMGSEDDEYQRREDSDDEGRYGITTRNQPPRKRRKITTSQEVYPVFTTDDDDDGEDAEDGLIISTVTKEGSDSEHASSGDAKARKRRSYWLSKGIGTGDAHDDSS
jgi:non-canonical poly(A) RNA polymerase PAPD5/7